ncbi:MAG TPA: PQQ-binding-like beta-propeller repeat protein, partial [Gemmataceae bacterium]|nr:PQQ-binding-like beta-propeller repeat protein [Gemmataceae bacterium]
VLRLLLLALAAGPLPRFDLHGDPLPPGAVARLGTVRYRIGDARVSALAPDGRTFAVADEGGVTLWDVRTGRPGGRIAFAEPTTPHALAYSPHGTRLVCTAGDQVHVLDPADGCVRWSRTCRDFRSAIGFLPGGTGFYVAERDEQRVAVFELAGGALDDRPLAEPVQHVSPCRRYFLRTDHFEDERGVREVRATLIAARTGRVCGEFSDLRLACLDGTEHISGAADWAVSPDDRRLYVLAHDGRLLTFDLATGKLADDLAPPDGWEAQPHDQGRLTLSPDGSIAYLLRAGSPIGRRDLKAKTWLPGLPAMPDGSLLAHPDGKQLLHVGSDGLLRRVDLATRREVTPGPGFIGGQTVSPSPDGRRIAVGSWAHGGGLAVFEADGRPVWRDPAAPVGRIVWHPDGRQLASVDDDTIAIRDAATGRERRRLTTPPLFRGCGGFGSWEDHERRVLRMQEEFVLAGGGGRLADRAGALFQLTQERIDAGWAGHDHGLRRWAAHPFESPDGAFLLTWEYGGLAVLRDPRTGDRVGAFQTGHTVVHHYAFSPDGLWLASAEGETIALWDVPSGRGLVTWKAPTRVTSVAFAGPGKLVTGLTDETALVWSLRPRKPPAGSAWDAIYGTDALDACRGVWALAADPAGPALLLQKIPRATASPAVGRWIKDLDANRYAVREKATAELAALGREAAGATRTALAAGPSAEARMRLEGVLAGLPTYRQYMELVHARAVLAMELAGTPAAKEVLKAWASGDPGATLTMDATAALARLGP